MTPTTNDQQTITIRAEGKLPGEELAIAIINARVKYMEWMSPEQRAKALDRMDHFEAFFDNLLAPLRNLAAKLNQPAVKE